MYRRHGIIEPILTVNLVDAANAGNVGPVLSHLGVPVGQVLVDKD